MAEGRVKNTELSAIAAAIRSKNGSSDTYKPGEMAAAISNLPSGAVVEPLTVTENGVYTPETGVDGFSSVSVDVNNGVNLPVSLLVTPPTQAQYTEGDVLDLSGVIVTAVYADGTTVDVTSDCTFSPADGATLGTVGTQIINVAWTGTGTVTGGSYSVALAGSTSVTVESAGPEIVPWATGTDEQIAAIVQALDNGDITVADTGWQIGDERVVQLSAMDATGVGESHAAQSVTMVLMDSGKFDLVGGGKDHFVVGQKHSLNEAGYMNSSDTNSGSWDGCARRAWCNNVYRNAIPATLRGCFKQFNVITAESYDGSTNKISKDYFALFAEKEIFGSSSYSNTTEAAALTQIEWYKNANNRKKNRSGSSNSWWERSPFLSGRYSFCAVGSNSSVDKDIANTTNGVAPFGCI